MGKVTPLHQNRPILALRQSEAEAIIRRRITDENTANVIFTDHAWDRVSERDITREDVFKVLRTGHCNEEPFQNEKKNWQVTIVKRMSGRREVGVVTIILDNDEKLVIRTVEWMDLR